MKTYEDDPNLTAYALGELPEEDRAQVEKLLANDPVARRYVEELRSFGRQLSDELHAEPAPQLTPAQKASLRPEAPAPRRLSWLVNARVFASAASVLLLVGLLSSFLLPALQSSREQAKMAFSPEATALSEKMRPIRLSKNGPVIRRELREMEHSEYRFVGDRQLIWCNLAAASAEDLYSPMLEPKPDGDDAGRPAHSRYGPSIEHYDSIAENAFQRVADHPLSTFSIDVDTAAYSNLRRFLTGGSLPPRDAVRIEELINYFTYEYKPPTGKVPFATHLEVAACPWRPEHRLVRIGLKGKVLEAKERPPCNLVFLLDVSGSMEDQNKLPLVKRAMSVLVQSLNEKDRVAIVVYAGASGLVLPSTSCENRQAILAALERLNAGGSTNGGEGINLAYAAAMKHFNREYVNRVILCTDGDFNVGVTQSGDLVELIKKKASQGVFLTVLGFGMGNYKDSTLEKLADSGNGNYGYVDTFNEARKLLVDQLTGTLVTIAKDVKIQVEFNPAQVAEYRLIGYENRMLRKEDFNDDKKDAGEIGAGHTVTALYEVVPAGRSALTSPAVDPLKYQKPGAVEAGEARGTSRDLLTVKLRYKQPDADVSSKVEFPLVDIDQPFLEASQDFRFAAAVAEFGMLLRRSEHKGAASYADVLKIARAAQGPDEYGYRREFIELVRSAQSLDKRE